MSYTKKIIAIIVLSIVTVSSIKAQEGSGFGLRAGINYNANGDYFNSISMASEDPTAAIGYHLGVFGKLGDKLYVKPELVYTKTKTEYSIGDFEVQKLDAPILVGLKVIGPLSVFAGPSFQYILDTEFENATLEDIEDDFSVGLNFGIGLNFNKIGIDLRYERGFSENEVTVITNNTTVSSDRLDTRAEQLILSVSFNL
ncbi:outer membrane beta-barrel protein [Lacinutrix sp. MedPE-SW]|uniref:outer membrane beta-barrel protein n=1 Tax=Lacinutrix sp. MedPE-SW TaxID=1860087 RepID=UPI00091165C3|nr:outer membrane beta-barrel protein [Lacinutrix sp. MedPE-SW]OIQ22654.1 MAG: hypothetical protein BM549_06120 [Lacinutrix sp. MedPE-SW]